MTTTVEETADRLRARLEQLDREISERREERSRIAESLKALVSPRGPKVQGQKAREWLEDLLIAEGPLKASVIHSAALQAGHTTKTLRRAADALGVVRTPPGGGRNCEWQLP